MGGVSEGKAPLLLAETIHEEPQGDYVRARERAASMYSQLVAVRREHAVARAASRDKGVWRGAQGGGAERGALAGVSCSMEQLLCMERESTLWRCRGGQWPQGKTPTCWAQHVLSSELSAYAL